ncbi:uncharacterized protein LOC143296499 [Babylonia areolata]|uniref:uncharacterized protein LOC143296499 n=1 Tax=Babylonia areolata TaxID=304850 RepID=UPI003FD59C49
MAAQHRWAVYLTITFVLSTLITGGVCQCGTGYGRVKRLKADPLTHGTLLSPGHPHKYPDNARCRWLVHADPGYVVHVHVAWIDVEWSYECSYDSLTFHDGQTVYHNEISKICNDAVKDFYSSGNYMYLEFTSDFNVNADGFELEYSAIRPSEVPTTVTPGPFDWPFRDTTTRTTTTTTATGSTGSSGSRYSWPGFSVAALVGGLSGALVLLFVLFALARYYLGRHYPAGGGGRRLEVRPYHPQHPPSAPLPSADALLQHHYNNNSSGNNNNNNGGVFMVSSTTTTSSHHHHHHHALFPSAPPLGGGVGGSTNMAFSPYGEAPPSYLAVLQQNTSSSTTVVQPGAGGGAVVGVGTGAGCYGPPPPSYTEAMMASHPPTDPPPPPPPLRQHQQQPPPPPPPPPPPQHQHQQQQQPPPPPPPARQAGPLDTGRVPATCTDVPPVTTAATAGMESAMVPQ